MHIDFTLPSEDLLPAFDDLEGVLRDDSTGDKARALLRYVSQAEQEMRERQLRSTDFASREAAGLLVEAFAAGYRTVVAAWSKLHGIELTR
jgi:hypothetical protein